MLLNFTKSFIHYATGYCAKTYGITDRFLSDHDLRNKNILPLQSSVQKFPSLTSNFPDLRTYTWKRSEVTSIETL